MEKGTNNIKTLILTGVLVVILALASAIYPKISAWYDNLINGANVTEVPEPTNGGNQMPTNFAAKDPTPTSAGATDVSDNNKEPVTIKDVPLADAPGNGGALDFYMVDKDGKTVRLSDFFGKPIVVNIWATWCGYCVKEFPMFDAAYKKYGDRAQFLFVDLCYDGETRAKADRFMAQKGYDFPVYYETLDAVLDTYNVGGIPYSLFIDSDGTIVRTQLGAFSSQNTLFKYIEEAINNSQIGK